MITRLSDNLLDNGSFYVYFAYDRDGVVRWVGKGINTRYYYKYYKFDTKQKRVSELWKDPLCRKEIYKSGLTEEDAFSLERELIQRLGREDLGTGPLWNLTDGGKGLLNPSQEVRESIGQKARVRMKGNSYNLGKKRTEEQLEEQRLRQKGRPGHKHTVETIEKIRVAKRGKRPSEETIKKMREMALNNRESMRSRALGNRNNRGRRWITNGIDNKRIYPTEILPEGWYYGMIK